MTGGPRFATGRLAALATGKVVWEDPATGETETEMMGWRDRWAVFGVHSYNWRWVRRLGQRGCGCTVNPITRRKVLTRMDCAEHGLSWAEVKGCAENPNCCCETGFDPKERALLDELSDPLAGKWYPKEDDHA